MVGSLVMLLAVLYVYKLAGTFEIAQIPAALVKAGLSAREELLLFGAFALSFAIKVPMFPFHTWLPDAHVEAPTSGSVMLAGVLLKMGTYGFIRFCLPLFPSASQSMAPLFCALALVGIVYGAFLALAQSDLKKLVAYSSISHLGFVVLGIFASVLTTSAGQPSHLALSGSVIQMVAHGLTTGALFLLVGMIYERRHTREIGEYGGLANQVPVFCTMLLIVTLGSIGLPGLAGFVGEFLILLGTAEAHWLLVAVAVSGVVLGALYMLYMVHRVVWGKLTNPANEGLEDLTGMEKAYMLPILVMIFVLGLFPGVFVDQVEKSSEAVIKQVDVGAAKLREARERDLRRAKGRQR
jgi:NADH-quinone oxidoreductase subunit M